MASKPSVPPTPEPQPIVRMPDKESASMNEAKMQKQRSLISQAGRESTLLSEDKLGDD